MKTLMDMQREVECKLNIYTLTTDYEIVYTLLDFGIITPSYLLKFTRLSSTAFYNRLKDLERDDVLSSAENPTDSRSKLYRLSDSMRELVITQHRRYMTLIQTSFNSDNESRETLNHYKSYIYRGSAVSHLTSDFQILLYLYIKSGISNIQISDFVDVSPTKFNASLVKLRSMGLVKHDRDPSDGRSKLYYLADHSRNALDDLHRQVFQWLESRS